MLVQLLARLRFVERGLAAILLGVIVFFVVIASVGRYFGVPLIWAIEAVQALFVWLSVLAADMTLQRSGHFSVDMFASLLPRPARRALELFNFLLVLTLLAILAYFGTKLTIVTSGRPMPIIGVTQAAATAALPIGFVLMFITTVEQALALLRGRSVERDAVGPREVM